MAQCQGPRAQIIKLFWSSPVFGRKMFQKSQSDRGTTQCKSGQGNNMVSRRNNLLHHFKIAIHLHLTSFYATKYLRKKKVKWNAHWTNFWIKSAWGTPGRTCTPIAGYFHDKTIISEEYVSVEYYLLLKYCRRQCTLLSPIWANH